MERRTGLGTIERGVCVLGLATLAVACAGENLFTATVGGAGSTPDLTITAPGASATTPLGDSIKVITQVTAADRADFVVYSGAYTPGGRNAFAAKTETLNGQISVELTAYLVAVGGRHTAGSAYIVVEMTEVLDMIGKDSVKVTIIS
jgi:hypothetical protein